MIIVDTALAQREAEGNPIRVALVGAGFMGRGFVNQVTNSVPGMVSAVRASSSVPSVTVQVPFCITVWKLSVVAPSLMCQCTTCRFPEAPFDE